MWAQHWTITEQRSQVFLPEAKLEGGVSLVLEYQCWWAEGEARGQNYRTCTRASQSLPKDVPQRTETS